MLLFFTISTTSWYFHHTKCVWQWENFFFNSNTKTCRTNAWNFNSFYACIYTYRSEIKNIKWIKISYISSTRLPITIKKYNHILDHIKIHRCMYFNSFYISSPQTDIKKINSILSTQVFNIFHSNLVLLFWLFW